MRSAQEIYDSTPFEDDNGLIPHDKLAVKVAEEYAGQFQPKWIEVKYDLPENRSMVLALHYRGSAIARYKHGCFFYDDGLEKMNTVTHWMPLPSPPQPC